MKLLATTVLVSSFVFSDAIAQEMFFTSIQPIPKIKRGKSYEVKWRGGSSEDVISIVLIDKKKSEIALSTTTNSGKTVVDIPSRIKPGTCSIRILNVTNGEIASSESVRIKRRIPLVVQVSPFVVIPVAYILIINAQGSIHEIEDIPASPGDPD